jgi:excisionase family DNA binding protein
MATIVTTKEVAEFLRLTESTICKLVAEGELPGFKIGDSWRFDMDEIMQHISEAKDMAKRKRKARVQKNVNSSHSPSRL